MPNRVNDTHYLRMAVNTLKASKFELWRVKQFGKRIGRINSETLHFDVYEYEGKDYMLNVIGGISTNI